VSATDAREIIEAVRLARRVAVTCLEESTDQQYALEEVDRMLQRIVMRYEAKRALAAAELRDWLGDTS
jgi:hypothetical protein